MIKKKTIIAHTLKLERGVCEHSYLSNSGSMSIDVRVNELIYASFLMFHMASIFLKIYIKVRSKILTVKVLV